MTRPLVVHLVEGHRRQLARHHVGALEATAEREEEPGLVAAHHRVGQPHDRGALRLDEGEEDRRPRPPAGRPLRGRAAQVALMCSQNSTGTT